PHEPGPHDCRRHRRGVAHDGGRARSGAARRAEESVMDFRPSSAQQLLISTAREFLRKHCPPELAQRVALDPRGFDEPLWRRMAELGWQGLLIPGDFGGSDGSLLDVILLLEEMGRAGAPGPFVPSAVVATLTLRLVAGSD